MALWCLGPWLAVGLHPPLWGRPLTPQSMRRGRSWTPPVLLSPVGLVGFKIGKAYCLSPRDGGLPFPSLLPSVFESRFVFLIHMSRSLPDALLTSGSEHSFCSHFSPQRRPCLLLSPCVRRIGSPCHSSPSVFSFIFFSSRLHVHSFGPWSVIADLCIYWLHSFLMLLFK